MINGIPENETEFLGLILQDPPSINAYRTRVPETAFTNELTRKIWEAMSGLSKAGTEISIPALREAISIDPARYSIPSLASFLMTCMQQAKGDLGLDDLAEILIRNTTGRRLSNEITEAQKSLGTGEDPFAILETLVDRLLGLALKQETDDGWLGDLADKAIKQSIEIAQGGQQPGLEYPFAALNEILDPMMPGDLIVLGAPSGGGKTSLATQIGAFVSDTTRAGPKRVSLMIQTEMRQLRVAQRVLAQMTGIAASRMLDGRITAADIDQLHSARDKARLIKMNIRRMPRVSMSQIRNRAKAFKREHGLHLLIIDHLKRLRADKKVNSRFEEISYCVEESKELAEELDVPVLLLSQMTRENQKRDDPKPTVDGLYGGGDIEENADAVVLVDRPEVILKRREPDPSYETEHEAWRRKKAEWKDRARIATGKQRAGDVGNEKKIGWSGPSTLFYDLDDGPDQEPFI